MLLNLVYVAIGLAGLYFGGDWLVRGASRLAASLGISPLVIGLTVVSFGTSMPELLVCLSAALQGSSDIAIGNVLGSNIANIGLILGVGGLITLIPIQLNLIRREIPIMVGSLILMLILSLDEQIAALDAVVLVVGLAAFNILLIRASLREKLSPADVQELELAEHIDPPINRAREFGFIALGLVGLAAGAQFLVTGAVSIAREVGVSELVIGVTLVAVGTSLPELVTTVIAATRKEQDLLFGNIIGSNIFNVLGILGITALVKPISIDPALLRFDFPVMILFGLAVIPFTLRTRLRRLEAALLLVAYAGYIAYTVVNGGVSPS